MKRRAFALLALLALAGCAARQRGAEATATPKPPENPWSWVPVESTVIGRAKLDALRGTPLWPLWTDLSAREGVSSWVDLQKVATVTFGGTGDKQENTSYIAALEGRFAGDELKALAQRDGIAAEPRGLLTLYRRPDGVWTQINDKLIVTCTADRLDALIARASAGAGTPVKSSPLYAALAERTQLEDSHLGIVAEDPEGTRRAAIERDAKRLGLGAIARDAKRLGLSVETGAAYRLVAVAEAESAARAETLAADVRDKLDALASNFLVRLLGVSALIGKLKTAQDGDFVFVRGTIDEAELSSVLQRVAGARDLAAATGGP